jgi:hypothetical protein
MSSKSLRQFVSGFFNPKGNLGDFRHASRTFVDDSFRLAPKAKFLFHVFFKINTNALKSLNFKYQHQNEIGILVKSADLPKFTVASETANQYNRKKVVQTKVDYQPISIKFHDDNLGVTRQLWENYFSYYYADPIASKIQGNYLRTATLGHSYIRSPYGLDNNSSIPFFDSIVIYQMARKYWNSYTLVNPLITSWNHDTVDYSNSNPGEQSMSIAYESVYYDNGLVSQGNPLGFGVDHYDTVPSPISLAGGGTRSLFGAGGVLAGASSVFGSVASGQAFSSPENFVATAITAVNTYNNSKQLSRTGITEELTNVTNKSLSTLSSPGAGAVRNTTFPVGDTAVPTVAQPRNLNP